MSMQELEPQLILKVELLGEWWICCFDCENQQLSEDRNCILDC